VEDWLGRSLFREVGEARDQAKVEEIVKGEIEKYFGGKKSTDWLWYMWEEVSPISSETVLKLQCTEICQRFRELCKSLTNSLRGR